MRGTLCNLTEIQHLTLHIQLTPRVVAASTDSFLDTLADALKEHSAILPFLRQIDTFQRHSDERMFVDLVESLFHTEVLECRPIRIRLCRFVNDVMLEGRASDSGDWYGTDYLTHV